MVFTSLADLAARIDDPDLDVEANDILVLQNAGPHSTSAMPEAGYLPIPKKLATKGVKDMVRVSDARMSGTAFGTIVLHVTPDSASGGPLGLVRNGDRIKLSVKERRIDLLVDEAELKKREATRAKPPAVPERGYAKLYAREITRRRSGLRFRVPQARIKPSTKRAHSAWRTYPRYLRVMRVYRFVGLTAKLTIATRAILTRVKSITHNVRPPLACPGGRPHRSAGSRSTEPWFGRSKSSVNFAVGEKSSPPARSALPSRLAATHVVDARGRAADRIVARLGRHCRRA